MSNESSLNKLKWNNIFNNYKDYQRKYPLIAFSLHSSEKNDVQSDLNGFNIFNLEHIIQQNIQHSKQYNQFLEDQDFKKSHLDTLLSFFPEGFHTEETLRHHKNISHQILNTEMDLLQCCMDASSLKNLSFDNEEEFESFKLNIFQLLQSKFDYIVDATKIPFAEIIQVELSMEEIESNTQNTQYTQYTQYSQNNQYTQINNSNNFKDNQQFRDTLNSSSLLYSGFDLTDEEKNEVLSELQLKTTKLIEEASSRGHIVFVGQVLHTIKKHNFIFRSIITGVKHNFHMKLNLLQSSCMNSIGYAHLAPFLQEILLFASLQSDITKTDWKLNTHNVEEDDVNIVQFYKEAPSLIQMLNTSFHYASMFQNTSCSFLIQYSHGALCFDFIQYLGKVVNANVFEISPHDIYSKLYQGEKGIANFSNQLFEIANESSPAIIVLSHIESFFPEDESEKDQYLIYEMLKILKRMKEWKSDGNYKVVIIGTTSDISSMDSFIRKRFDQEITLDIPSIKVRMKIISYILEILLPNYDESMVSKLTELTHGYTMSNLKEMIQKVSFKAAHRYYLQDNNLINFGIDEDDADDRNDTNENEVAYEVEIQDSNINEENLVQFQDFLEYTKYNRPLSIQSQVDAISLPQKPSVSWSEIGGLLDVKEKLEQLIVWPIQYSKLFHRMKVRPPSGILLYGPPGVGKTLIAKAICTTANINFISVHIPDLIRAEIGESEKSLSQVFRRAKLAAPCVIFFDEIQAMFGDRSSVSKSQQKLISQFILELDALEYSESNDSSNTLDKSNKDELEEISNAILVIAATNVPDHIDPTLLRSKRLEYCIYVGLPDEEARKCIFEQQFKKLKVSESVWGKMEYLIDSTEGYSGADIVNVCQQAGLNAMMRNDTESIKFQDFELGLKTVKPGVTKEYLDYLESWKPNQF